VDQAWIIDRGRRIEERRIDDALRFVKDRGVTFHWGEPGVASGRQRLHARKPAVWAAAAVAKKRTLARLGRTEGQLGRQ
jgi:hypothetical protein